jgi:LysR family transcriptional regulator, low CO2-responsive transcriptional regulator
MRYAHLRRLLKHGTLPQLSVFEAVKRLGSFTRAAEELHLAQPTVSTQVRKLSETLGLPLFDQVGKKLHVTEAGRELYVSCQALFEELARLDDKLGRLRSTEAGRLRIAISTTAEYFMPRLLAAFCALHPEVHVELQVCNRHALLERLTSNLDDLYVFTHPPQDIGLVTHTLAANPMHVYARDDHRLAHKRRIDFAELEHEPFIVREPGSGTRSIVEEVFAQRHATPNVRLELGSNQAVRQAILAGLGVSILPAHGVEAEHAAAMVALDVKGFPLLRQSVLVHCEGKQLPPTASLFFAFAKEGQASPDRRSRQPR